ncbi:PTS sugar transporter subunit IIA [Catenulispora pinisilvae]|uniref:PTS sugar transporter subunit IIA n=1 Tax=Catenulispora pinisilvae TaxID=2705253 RepID=UPI0018918F25|nr:PTS glucose transporter subunit IIA [Catenulispora pinisilvae]
MDISISSPLTGTAIGLAQVPDPVFAGSMVGPGAAVDPERAPQVAVAPIAGRLVKLKPHAFVVQSEDGRGVLVHLGIDTVNLDGAGFELVAAEGDQLRAGQPIVTWNPADVQARGLSPVSPVIALDAETAAIEAIVAGAVAAGDELFHWR